MFISEKKVEGFEWKPKSIKTLKNASVYVKDSDKMDEEGKKKIIANMIEQAL